MSPAPARPRQPPMLQHTARLSQQGFEVTARRVEVQWPWGFLHRNLLALCRDGELLAGAAELCSLMRRGSAHPGPRPTRGHCWGSTLPPASPIPTQRGPATAASYSPARGPSQQRFRTRGACGRVWLPPITGFLATSKEGKGHSPPWATGEEQQHMGELGGSEHPWSKGQMPPPGPVAPAPTFPAAPRQLRQMRRQTHSSPAKPVPRLSPVPPQLPGLGAAGGGP